MTLTPQQREKLLRERAEKAESLAAGEEERTDIEAGRAQDAIYKLIQSHVPKPDLIDGGGCDSGDWLDVTLSEIGQGIAQLREQTEAVEAERDTALRERDQARKTYALIVESRDIAEQACLSSLTQAKKAITAAGHRTSCQFKACSCGSVEEFKVESGEFWRMIHASTSLTSETPPSHETQASITEWADATFGTSADALRVAKRAQEELCELIEALEADPQSAKAPEECADVAIALYLAASRMGSALHAQIDLKMAINRKRIWKLDGTGCGYHERAQTPPKPLPKTEIHIDVDD